MLSSVRERKERGTVAPREDGDDRGRPPLDDGGWRTDDDRVRSAAAAAVNEVVLGRAANRTIASPPPKAVRISYSNARRRRGLRVKI